MVGGSPKTAGPLGRRHRSNLGHPRGGLFFVLNTQDTAVLVDTGLGFGLGNAAG